MNEKVQRLVMHAFRGVPGEMTVDFGKGESIVVYGDNGTGKSTIADALEWYFTGEIELLSHEGRQHAVRYVGGETDGVTSVEVVTNGTLGGKVVFPDERNAESVPGAPARDVPPSRTHARGLHQQDEDGEVEGAGRNPRPGRDRESSRRPATGAKRASQGVQSRGRRGPNLPSSLGVGIRGQSADETVLANLQQICGMLGVDPPQSLDQVVDPSWLTAAVGASAPRSEGVRPREPAGRDQDAERAGLRQGARSKRGTTLVSSDRARLLPRASLVREAKRLFETRSIDKGRCPLCGQKVDDKSLARQNRERARRRDGSVSRSRALSRSDRSSRRTISRRRTTSGSSIHDRARAVELELPPLPDVPARERSESSVEALAPVDIDAITSALSEHPQVGPGGGQAGAKSVARRTQHARHAARDAGRVVPADQCLAAGGEEGRARPARAGSRRDASSTRIRRSRRKTWPSS